MISIAAATSQQQQADEEGKESLPPSGYIVAGKMRLGSFSVPALNSVHLRSTSNKLIPRPQENIRDLGGEERFQGGATESIASSSNKNENDLVDYFSERETFSELSHRQDEVSIKIRWFLIRALKSLFSLLKLNGI